MTGTLDAEPGAPDLRTDAPPPGARGAGLGGLVVAAVAVVAVVAGLAIGLAPRGTGAWKATYDLLADLRDHVFTGLPRNLGALPVVALHAAWCGLLGAALLRLLRVELSRLEEVTLGVIFGWLPAQTITVVVGTTIGLGTALLLVVAAVTAAAAVAVLALRPPVRPRSPLGAAVRALRPRGRDLALLVVLAGLLLLPLLGSLQPETNWDGRWYHLGPAAHYVENGSFYNTVRETGMAVTALPSYDETLRVGLFAVDGEVAAKAMSLAEMVVLLGLLVAAGRRWFGSVTPGLAAGVGLCAIPVATWAAATSYVDLAVGIVTTAMVYATLRHRERHDGRWLVVLGLLGGYVVGVKLYGAFGAVGCALVALWPARGERPQLRPMLRAAVQGGVGLAIGWLPGLLRSAVQTGNPVFPALSGLFPSDYWNEARQRTGLDGLQPVSLLELPVKLARLPYDTVVDADRLNTVIGPFFLIVVPTLVVAALVLGRRRLAVPLWPFPLVALVWVLAWLKLGLPDTRYLLAVLPVLMLGLAGLAASVDWARSRVAVVGAVAAFAVAVAAGSPYAVHLLRQSAPERSTGAINLITKYLYDGAPASDYTEPYFVRAVNEHVPADGKVIADGYPYTFYLSMRPEVLASSATDGPASLRTWSLCNADAPWRMRDAGVTHVLTPVGAAKVLDGSLAPYLHEITTTEDGWELLSFDAAAVGPEPAAVDHTFCPLYG